MYTLTLSSIERKRVAVTATTGLAATQLAPLKAITIHRYAGLLDGRFSNEELSDMLLHDDDRRDTHDSILNTDVIVIDEVSMLSQRTLEQLNFVCQKIHKNNKPFGGMQTILAGDFFQLPPVTSRYLPFPTMTMETKEIIVSRAQFLSK